ncbi:MAG TPA: hypothetical protein VGE98_12440, partial [Thermoanaerobaculia bacterium]
VAFVVTAAFTAPAPASADSFVCYCSGPLQQTGTFSECASTCADATAGVQLDAYAAAGCDMCCFHPEITCTQLGDGSYQATGYAYYICAGGGGSNF